MAAFLTSGKTVAEVAREYGLAEPTVREWLRHASEEAVQVGSAPAAPTADESADREAEARTRAEIESALAEAAEAVASARAQIAAVYAEAVEAIVRAEVLAAEKVAQAEAAAAERVAQAEAAAASAMARAEAAAARAVSDVGDAVEMETEDEAAARAEIAALLRRLEPVEVWVQAIGRTLAEARQAALDQLGVDESEAEFEVLEKGSRWLPGRVRVRARIRVPEVSISA
ncbi:MAG: Jag N-terminal domain-containing protein [Actinomycetota bacterium]